MLLHYRILAGIGLAAILPMTPLSLAAAADSGAKASLVVAAPSDWVRPLSFDQKSKQPQAASGEEQRWLLWERQINARENERFFHGVRQILTTSGVQTGSQISIDFDSGHETLTLHWVRLWRDGKRLNRLDRDKIRIIQPERDLDRFLFNGKHSAVLLLEDVRAGDIVDYAFTRRGDNTVLAGRFSDAIPVQLPLPVERIVTRLRWPNERRLHFKNHRTNARPRVGRGREFTEYLWDFRNVPGLPIEDSVPIWHDPDPWVQLSEFQSWSEVNQWAMKLFENQAPLSSELTQTINEWRRIGNREDRVAAVLQFVQDKVRYFGIETGAGSHKPSDPSTVFSRRFGDCKDKTLLFVSALRELGVEASPVLVHSQWRHRIEEMHPSATVFDHVIARVALDGRTFWLDPTMTHQRGPLAGRHLAAYGRGLVVDRGTRGLSSIPPAGDPPRTTVTQYFDIGGKYDPARLEVVTVAEGLDAERLRQEFASTRRDEIETAYLNFYARHYPGIRQTRPLRFADDQQRNRIETTEHYTIDRIWIYSAEDQEYRSRFSPDNVLACLVKPAVSYRTMPLALPHPVHQVFRAEINLPETWVVRPRNKVIEEPAFFFRMDIRPSVRKVTMEYEYRSLADAVHAGRIQRHVERTGEALEDSGYILKWR